MMIMAARSNRLILLFRLVALLIFATALVTPWGPLRAEVQITDSGADTLVLQAHDATLRQVLDALATKRMIIVRSTDPLSQSLSGTYSGSTQRVLARVLEGYDHIVETAASGIRVIIFGPAGAAKPMPPGAQAPMPMPTGISTNVDLERAQSAAPPPPSQRESRRPW